jgi:hypothetical protein
MRDRPSATRFWVLHVIGIEAMLLLPVGFIVGTSGLYPPLSHVLVTVAFFGTLGALVLVMWNLARRPSVQGPPWRPTSPEGVRGNGTDQ